MGRNKGKGKDKVRGCEVCPLLMSLLKRKRKALTFAQIMAALSCPFRRCLHQDIVILEKNKMLTSKMQRVKSDKGSMRWERFYKLKRGAK